MAIRKKHCGLLFGMFLSMSPLHSTIAAVQEEDAATPQATEPAETTEKTSSNVVTLDEVLITAKRSPGIAFDAPYATDVVTQQEFEDRMYRTIPDALRFTPGIMVQKTSYGQGSPYIRGFTGFRNVMLVDGIRLNNSVFRDGPNQYWNTIDPFSIGRLEIVKGPGSVLYGSDAIGGVVNAITKSPHTYGEGVQYGARTYYRVSSAENSHIGRGELSLGLDQHTGFFFGGTGKHFGDLIGGDNTGRQPGTGYDEWDADFKIEHFLTPDTRLIAAHQRVTQNNVPRTHSTVDAVPFHGSSVGSDLRRELDQNRELTYIQLHSENIGSFVDTLSVSLSWHEQHETRDRIRGSSAQEFQGFDVGTFGFWVQAESGWSLGRLTYGVEYYHDHVNAFSSTNAIQGPVADQSNYDLVGVYIQNETPIAERLDLTLGGRYTFAAADVGSFEDPNNPGVASSLSEDWSAWTGSARLTYQLTPKTVNVFAGISQGFRAPNLSDLTRLDIARTGEIETPAPGLDPEHFLSYEVGVKVRQRAWAAQLAYFYTDIEDMIVRVPTGALIGPDTEVTKLNAGDGYIQGIELGASWQVHAQWSLFGNIAWNEGEVDTFPTAAPVKVSEYIDRVMPITSNIGIRYDAANRKWWAEFTATIADTADKLSTRDASDTSRIPPGGTPGFTLLSLRSGWRVHDQVDLTFAIENLADEDYRIHGSGTNEAGRNFVFGMEVKF